MSKRARFVFISIAIVYLTSFLFLHRGTAPQAGWTQIISSDGAGFYSYLPKVFLEGNLTYSEKDNLFCSPTENGAYINRFYCGTALLELPFFTMGCVCAKLFGFPVDGYSLPFALAIGLAALFYALVAFVVLFKILTRYWNISESTALLTVLFTALGTNIIFYSTYFSSFSHVYSFFTITSFVFYLHKTIREPKTKNIFIVSILFSLFVFIRPVNLVVILLVPALFKGKSVCIDFFKLLLTTRHLVFLILGLCIPFIIQCGIWYAQTGHFIEWSYKQEGFYFLQPKWWDMLFGFRRGLFIYCPLLFIALPGLYFMFNRNKWQTFWVGLFLFVFTWISASWWHYTYGDTFGIRPFNDILFVWSLLLAFVLQHIRWKKIMLTFCIAFTFLNLVFSYQFAISILTASSMNADKFFNLFLKTSPKYVNYYGGSQDIPPYAPNGFRTIHSFTNHYDTLPEKNFHVKGYEWVGGTACIYPKELKYTRHSWIEVSYKRKLLTLQGMKKVLFVFHTIDPINDSTKIYYTFNVKEYPDERVNTWQSVTHRIWLPNSLNGNDIIKMHMWNVGKEEFYLDDYHIKLQVPKW